MIKLTDKDKKYLKFIGHEESDFAQIEYAMNKSTFGVFKAGNIDECKVIDYETARELLGNENLLSGLSRSSFHCSTSREIPHTFGNYNIHIDSGILFSNSKSRLLRIHNEDYIDLEYVKKLQSAPCLRIFDIKWDTSDEIYEEYFDLFQLLPNEIIIFLDEMPKNEDELSDYILNKTGFRHIGFRKDCNYTQEQLIEYIQRRNSQLNILIET